MRIPYISLLAASALALGGCAYGDLGLGMGYGDPYYGYGGYGSYGGYGGYGGYGYGSPYYGYGYGGGPTISIGYGNYYGSRYSPYYGGYGYGSPYYGWYDNYYYPGSGYYVYDSYRRPHVMTTTQRQYWSSRSPSLRTNTTATTTRVQPNWSGFDRRTTTYTARQTAREDRQTAREQRRADRQERQQRRRDDRSD